MERLDRNYFRCCGDDLDRQLAAMQNQIEKLERNEKTMLLRIMTLEKLGGATPTEVSLATADRVMRMRKLRFATDMDIDEENDPYGNLG